MLQISQTFQPGIIDEIPADWPMTNPIVPACDFLCHLAEMEPAE